MKVLKKKFDTALLYNKIIKVRNSPITQKLLAFNVLSYIRY